MAVLTWSEFRDEVDRQVREMGETGDSLTVHTISWMSGLKGVRLEVSRGRQPGAPQGAPSAWLTVR